MNITIQYWAHCVNKFFNEGINGIAFSENAYIIWCLVRIDLFPKICLFIRTQILICICD